jgi:two-component system cell cycle sensor histidine kinase/response regulator CckA
MRDSRGNIVGVINSIMDVTARRAAEEENKKLLHALGERIKELTCLYRTAEILRDESKEIHEMVAEIAHLLPKAWQYPEDAAAQIVYREACVRSSRYVESQWSQRADLFDVRGVCGFVEVVYLSEHPTVYDGAFLQEERKLINSVAEMLSSAINRRSLEEQVRQSQKMEAIGQLAGGIAHDFNNLLTVINGYSDLILGSLDDGDPNKTKVDQILKAGKRSAELTQQLLAFGRKQILSPKHLNLNSIVADTQKMLKRVIGEDVEVTTDLDSGLSSIIADPSQMQQVLLNLILNARDAMPNGGTLLIETRNSEPPSNSGDIRDWVRLTVSDSGIGISEEVRDRVFEPFYTTKSPGKGTGLGLAVVHGIVRQSEGYIDLRTSVGEGSSFDVYLPATAEDMPSQQNAKGDAPAPSGSETILIVEDEEAVRGLAKEILTEYGYRVLDSRDGSTALEICSKPGVNVDLLISDVVMPGMGGVEIAEKVVEIFPKAKVLFVSGYPDDDMLRRGILHDEVNFLPKPFSPDGLAYKVFELLKQR